MRVVFVVVVVVVFFLLFFFWGGFERLDTILNYSVNLSYTGSVSGKQVDNVPRIGRFPLVRTYHFFTTKRPNENKKL